MKEGAELGEASLGNELLQKDVKLLQAKVTLHALRRHSFPTDHDSLGKLRDLVVSCFLYVSLPSSEEPVKECREKRRVESIPIHFDRACQTGVLHGKLLDCKELVLEEEIVPSSLDERDDTEQKLLLQQWHQFFNSSAYGMLLEEAHQLLPLLLLPLLRIEHRRVQLHPLAGAVLSCQEEVMNSTAELLKLAPHQGAPQGQAYLFALAAALQSLPASEEGVRRELHSGGPLHEKGLATLTNA